MWSWIARILAPWANYAQVRARLDAESDLRAEQAMGKQKDSTNAVQKSEIEYLAAWQSKTLAVLRKEADIARAASVLSTEIPERE